jgi:hypothetical protein
MIISEIFPKHRSGVFAFYTSFSHPCTLSLMAPGSELQRGKYYVPQN